MTLKILLTGRDGQLGRALSLWLPRLGDVIATDRRQLDLCNPSQIRQTIRSLHPGLIVNAAAYTNVDQAESDQTSAQALNVDAPRTLAEEAKQVGAALVHFSTDYVFDGTKRTPYVEDDVPKPLSTYGRTKLEGEKAIQESGVSHVIFRSAWVYAREGRNFPLTILRLATERSELRVVRDQVGSPTWSWEVAAATTNVLSQIYGCEDPRVAFSRVGGIYHMTAAGEASWFEFATAIMEEARRHAPDSPWFIAATGQRPLIAQHISPITTAEYPTPARRPAYSVLSNARLAGTFGTRLPDWRAQLRSAFTARLTALPETTDSD
jgi:dTDP-4-dehydrorhamnose reductase